jgi:hypothetical protein
MPEQFRKRLLVLLAVCVMTLGSSTLGIGTSGVATLAAEPISFRYDVLPALSKQGCSGGACHGSPTGKGGFRLSLRGFDPVQDTETLLREEQGRRVNSLDPEASLLLRKPTMQISHGGGRRLHKQDLSFKILRDWIAAGCPDDAKDAAICLKIEVRPKRQEIDFAQQLLPLKVTAHFSNNTVRDITSLAVYSSSNEQVLTVNSDGTLSKKLRGEATVLVRYLDFIDTTEVALLQDVAGFEWPKLAETNSIDQLLFPKLRKLQILPSEKCGDSEFIRRVTLDVTGLLPTRVEVETFLADDSPDKRKRLIDQLLTRPSYAQFWAQKWGDLLRIKNSRMTNSGVNKFHRWLVNAMAENRPYDQIASDLLTARGGTFSNPAANYFRAANNVNDCAETTAQLFLGIRIQCAKCHNHPFDRWSQDNYYGLAAFFSRVQRTPGNTAGEMHVWLDRDSEVTQPRTQVKMKPWLPLQGEVNLKDGVDRREKLAEWLVDAKNPFFAKVAVNRTWAQLMGRGIVEPVDDFRADNPPSHPLLLNSLAKKFVESGFDQKQLIRKILNSRVYQLSSKTNKLNESDDRYFSHAYARLLSAEQLLDAVCRLTGDYESFPGLPPRTNATALPSPDVGGDFLRTFGRPSRNTACECERIDKPNLTQALQLINGPLLVRKIASTNGRLSRLLDETRGRLVAAGQPPQEGLVARFAADEMQTNNTLPANNHPVERWASSVSENLSAIQDKNDRRPVFIRNGIGRLPTVRFDGKNDFLYHPESSLVDEGSPRTVFIVGRMEGPKGGPLFTFRRNRPVFTAQHVDVNGTYYLYSAYTSPDANTTAPHEHIAKLKSPFVTTYLSKGVGPKIEVYVNGSKLPIVQKSGVDKDSGPIGFTIGAREDLPIGQQMWQGDISEILVYNQALSEEQRKVAGTYLSTKYSLNGNYPKIAVKLKGKSLREIIRELYLVAYSRPPTEAETKYVMNEADEYESHRILLEDLTWAIINTKEFLFQH